MKEILIKLVKGDKISSDDIMDALHGICEDLHASCRDGCPIYEIFKGVPYDDRGHCPYHKNGPKMLRALQKHYDKH